MSRTDIPSPSRLTNSLFPVYLTWGLETLTVGALLDSGADECLIDVTLARQAGNPLECMDTTLSAQALDRHVLGKILDHIIPISLTISGNHVENFQFFVLHGPTAPLVLGRPWLNLHDPHVSWSTGRILGWSKVCHATRLRSAPSPPSGARPTHSPPDLSAVPSVYHNLARVFSKDQALLLPPHRPYDCTIDLLLGAPLPVGRLYNLSVPEKETTRNYISESLASGIIRPSSSPVAAGFFFVAKKDGSLRSCIDYRQLNNITVKNKYPLPLLSSTFKPLTHTTVFTKLDLRNAYHLVCIREGDEWKTGFNTHLGHFEYLVMPFGLTNNLAVFQALVNDVLQDFLNTFVVVYLDDILVFSRTPQEHTCHVCQVLHRLLENRLFVKAVKCVFHATSVEFLGYILEKGRVRADPKKVQAVEEWERPTDRTQLRWFLGFANFYRRFIQGFSRDAAPLSALTSTLHPFSWSPEAEAAFSSQKSLFTSAPVLIFPNPGHQFIVEVDASDVGIGAVLFQRPEEDQLIHPVTFLSRRFTPAERNYDVGNRELLAVQAALEVWRHWLEGAQHPILIWMVHKNLTYIRNAKRLGPRQARWALLFSRFNFTLTFRPGSKNVHADTLSHLFPTETQPQSSDQHTILPPARVIGVVTWGVGCLRGPAHPTRSGGGAPGIASSCQRPSGAEF